MRVGLVVASVAPSYGGPPVVVVQLGEHLRGLGCDVTCYATVSEVEKEEVRGIPKWIRLFPRTRPESWYRSPDLSAHLGREVGTFDVLHLHQVWDYPLQVASRYARGSRVPYVITPHGALEPWCVAQKRWKKRLYSRLIARTMLNHSACVQAITPQELGGFVKFGLTNRFTVVPNGVDADAVSALPPRREAEALWPGLERHKVVLFLGRIHPKKGLDRLVPAWTKASRKHGDAVLVIAGPDEGRYSSAVRALSQSEGVEKSIMFTGMLSGREKLAMLARADMFVLPSYSEGFSMAVLEAMACGLPCVLTPGCHFPEAEKAGAALIVEPERQSLAEAIDSMLSMTQGERRAMGECGRKLVFGNYTWEIAARKMITVYRCLLEKRLVPLYPEPACV